MLEATHGDSHTTATRQGAQNTQWQLLKNPWSLTDLEDKKLADLQKTNERIYRGYLLKETLVAIFERSSLLIAGWKLDEWEAWASRSRLAPFVKLAKTIRKHRQCILEYVRDRLNNGRVEELNGKTRTITRRSGRTRRRRVRGRLAALLGVPP